MKLCPSMNESQFFIKKTYYSQFGYLLRFIGYIYDTLA